MVNDQCAGDNCWRPAVSHGRCFMHRKRMLLYGVMEPYSWVKCSGRCEKKKRRLWNDLTWTCEGCQKPLLTSEERGERMRSVAQSRSQEERTGSAKRAWETKRRRYPDKFPEIQYRVDDSGCWRWIMAKDENGYGMCSRRIGGKSVRLAHRVFYEQAKGTFLDKSVILHHTCRNRDCVNPDHLEEQTRSAHAILHNAGRIKKT